LKRPSLVAALVLVLCFAYALVRYVVFGTTSPHQIPAWITNKAFAFATVPLLFTCLWNLGRGPAFRAWVRLLQCFALAHVLLTAALLSPLAYPKLYPAGRLTWKGELVLLAGVLAALALTQVRRRGSALALAALAVVVHVGFLGFASWFTPSAWPGHLPPITLLCALGAAASLACLRRGAPRTA